MAATASDMRLGPNRNTSKKGANTADTNAASDEYRKKKAMITHVSYVASPST